MAAAKVNCQTVMENGETGQSWNQSWVWKLETGDRLGQEGWMRASEAAGSLPIGGKIQSSEETQAVYKSLGSSGESQAICGRVLVETESPRNERANKAGDQNWRPGVGYGPQNPG